MIKKSFTLFSFLSVFAFTACGNQTTNSANNNTTTVQYQQQSPDFDADSAYYFTNKQVEFGYRIPNSDAHKKCGDYLVAELKRFGAAVQEQQMTVTTYDNTKLNARNIIGSYNLEDSERILLFAHWDTRPFADNDPNPANRSTPVLGANDGASGVGVLLEIARNIHKQTPNLGIDIIFFDAEDYGPGAEAYETAPEGDWWCLGSQYWAKNPHTPNYTARFGILLDMVGATNAKFYKEYFSTKYASNIVGKVWGSAHQLGYGNFFINDMGGAITDDHLPVNEIRNIPSIDIIQHDPSTESNFGHYWHTVNDNMDNVSKETLKAVGQTVMEVIYKEK